MFALHFWLLASELQKCISRQASYTISIFESANGVCLDVVVHFRLAAPYCNALEVLFTKH